MNGNVMLKYKNICESLPLVDRVEVFNNSLKLVTDILMGGTDTFLNLFLIFDGDDVCLSDSNEIYRLCDGFYDVSEENLKKIAEKTGLDYEDYRFTKLVDEDTIGDTISKFETVRDIICEY